LQKLREVMLTFSYHIRATLIEESSMLCNLYFTILERKESPIIIVSDFLK
jgi:hypothetical protein